jgi:hypothetical protein
MSVWWRLPEEKTNAEKTIEARRKTFYTELTRYHPEHLENAMKKTTATLLTLIALMLISVPAFANRCEIKNTTKYAFDVEIKHGGTVTGTTIPSYTYMSMTAGRFIAKSKSGGKSFGGNCASGSKLKIVIVKGVVMVVPY